MEFDVIIYVLIGIVWVIVTIIQASQKAKKKSGLNRPQVKTTQSASMNYNSSASNTNQSYRSSTSNEGIENWLAELMGVETPKPKSSFVEIEEAEMEKNFTTSSIEHMSTPLDVIEDEEGITTTSLKESSIGSSNFVSQQYESNILSDFDLRKAIIYSEILKRPYN